MDKNLTLRLVQGIALVGAVADGIWTAILVSPDMYLKLTDTLVQSDKLIAGPVFGIAASLMAGWTVLLAWTSFKPVERRAVFLFTAFPVIAGLFWVAAVGYIDSPGPTLWIPIKLVLLFAAMLWAYFTSGRIARGAGDAH